MAFLFTYGTLQEADIQEALFGRKLKRSPDTLMGYGLSEQKVAGLYPVIFKSDEPKDTLHGVVYKITEEELVTADAYEGTEYHRIQVVLGSGISAWTYVGKCPF